MVRKEITETTIHSTCLTFITEVQSIRALVDGKVDFINGRGWSVDQSANVTNQSMAQAKLFIASPNPDETLNKLSRQINFDDVLYGGYYLGVDLE